MVGVQSVRRKDKKEKDGAKVWSECRECAEIVRRKDKKERSGQWYGKSAESVRKKVRKYRMGWDRFSTREGK